MTSSLNIVLAFLLISLIIIYKIYKYKMYKNYKVNKVYKVKSKYDYDKVKKSKKVKNKIKSPFAKKRENINNIIYSVSLIMFIVTLLMNLINKEKVGDSLINALTILIITWPVTINELFLDDEMEQISKVKTIITNIIDQRFIKKFREAGINLIILSKKTKGLKYLTKEEQDVPRLTKMELKKTLIIKTDNIKILEKVDILDAVYEFDNLEDTYMKIYEARGLIDNDFRTFKYLIVTYLPLVFSFIFLNIMGFPFFYNILLAVLLKILTFFVSKMVYSDLPFDVDIMKRQPRDNEFLGKQESIFIFIQSVFNFCMMSLPYMLVLAEGGSQSFGNTLFFIMFIYINLFMTLSYYSEENIFKNIGRAFKNKRMILFIISCILITLFFNFNGYFNTRNIELLNYISCLFFSFVIVLFNEFIKWARVISNKQKRKEKGDEK